MLLRWNPTLDRVCQSDIIFQYQASEAAMVPGGFLCYLHKKGLNKYYIILAKFCIELTLNEQD